MILQTNCVVCGTNALHLRPGEDPACQRPECRFVVAQKSKMAPVIYARFFADRSRRIRELDRLSQEKLQQERLAREKEDSENRLYWQTQSDKIPGYRAEKHPLLAIPQNRRKLVTLAERRKRNFRDKLNRLISLVTESPNAIYTDKLHPNPVSAAPAKFLGGACALCRGACCLNGRDHAYVAELTLVRVMQTQPSLRPRHILDLYLSHLGYKTYENSCLFHGEKGCSLPADLRSNTCSNYFCPSINTFIQAFDEAEKPEGAFVVIRAREHWPFPEGADNGIAGGFLLTETGTLPLD